MDKIIYEGNSSDFYNPNNFQKFMENLPWTYLTGTLEKNSVEITQFYLVGDTILTHQARKRMVPKDRGLWSVTVALHGEEDINDIGNFLSNAAEPKN